MCIEPERRSTTTPLPNFLIVGAPRAGTTSLHNHLSAQPEVFMCAEKEPNFFALAGRPFDFRGPGLDSVRQRSAKTLEEYLAMFSDAGEARAVGESSTQYLYFPQAARSIAAMLPDVKIVAVLRNPADRAFSSYLHLSGLDLEPLETFEEALLAEGRRIEERWWPSYYYRGKGFYAEQLERYFREFPANRVRVYLQEDLHRDQDAVLEDLHAFLGLSTRRTAAAPQRVNASGLPRSRLLHRLLNRPSRGKEILKLLVPARLAERAYIAVQDRNLARPTQAAETRAELLEGYEADIKRLARLIGRDLSHWLN